MKKKMRKGVSNLTYALLTVPIVLIISTAIFASFSTNINQAGWTATANTSFTSIVTQTWNGYNLAALLPFILIAVVIIGVILGALVFR